MTSVASTTSAMSSASTAAVTTSSSSVAASASSRCRCGCCTRIATLGGRARCWHCFTHVVLLSQDSREHGQQLFRCLLVKSLLIFPLGSRYLGLVVISSDCVRPRNHQFVMLLLMLPPRRSLALSWLRCSLWALLKWPLAVSLQLPCIADAVVVQ